MAENRSRFVLLCQQSLAFGLVAAVIAPAAGVATLDIVAPPHDEPGAVAPVPPSETADSGVIGALDRRTTPSTVASAPVRPTVRTVPLGRVARAGGPAARLTSAGAGSTRPTELAALSAPQPVDGLATVGVTWRPGDTVDDAAIAVAVRTRTGDAWSAWQRVPYHDEEGPDPSSPDGRADRPGTDPVYVGDVDAVQVRALTDTGAAPAGMALSLVDPGRQHARLERPAIDTGKLALSAAGTDPASDPAGDPAGDPASDPASDPAVGVVDAGAATLAGAGTATAKPRIYSRAQWGADERMRDASSLHYGEVHGGFVHHTVNANSYTRGQVPAIIRGIYAYHTQSRGWSDVGYNFLVDRFGRIWEGRYGGVDRPVVGAHTLGYNDDSFAMSAIGNYDVTRPSSATVDAYARLFAWKLSLSGVRAGSTHQWVTKRYLPAIEGHRDVGQTACPGRYLYAKIPEIRSRAARYQRSFSGRQRQTDLVGLAKPDLVVRNARTKQAYLVRTASSGRAGRVTPTGTYLRYADRVLNVGDWDGDRHGDLVTRSGGSGLLYLYRGTGTGRFAAPIRMTSARFGSVRLLTAVGDYTGDGRPDLVGQPRGGSMRIYPGNGRHGFRGSYVAHSPITASQQLGVGLWTSDGAPDTVVRRGDRSLVLYPGNGPGGLTGGTRIGSVSRAYDWVVAAGDLTGDRRSDLVVRASATGRLWMLPGRSDGFGSRRPYATGDLRRFDLVGQ